MDVTLVFGRQSRNASGLRLQPISYKGSPYGMMFSREVRLSENEVRAIKQGSVLLASGSEKVTYKEVLIFTDRSTRFDIIPESVDLDRPSVRIDNQPENAHYVDPWYAPAADPAVSPELLQQ